MTNRLAAGAVAFFATMPWMPLDLLAVPQPPNDARRPSADLDPILRLTNKLDGMAKASNRITVLVALGDKEFAGAEKEVTAGWKMARSALLDGQARAQATTVRAMQTAFDLRDPSKATEAIEEATKALSRDRERATLLVETAQSLGVKRAPEPPASKDKEQQKSPGFQIILADPFSAALDREGVPDVVAKMLSGGLLQLQKSLMDTDGSRSAKDIFRGMFEGKKNPAWATRPANFDGERFVLAYLELSSRAETIEAGVRRIDDILRTKGDPQLQPFRMAWEKQRPSLLVDVGEARQEYEKLLKTGMIDGNRPEVRAKVSELPRKLDVAAGVIQTALPILQGASQKK